MATRVVLGVDIGTSSSKGVLVDDDGNIVRIATRSHSAERPNAGFVEMDAMLWWDEFVDIAVELVGDGQHEIGAVGVSGMGPCVLLVDDSGEPVRPAILYGVDTRATSQIDSINAQFGEIEIMRRGRSALSSQAVGPKIVWVRENEPRAYQRSRRLFMPSSWLVNKLTDEYVLDYHSASQCSPLFDANDLDWNSEWSTELAPGLELPSLLWPGEVAGVITPTASAITGLPTGIPVIARTIDAWMESASVGAVHSGDLMLMYGTTMFLVNTITEPLTSASMWGTIGLLPGTFNLAGGMATSGAITAWLRDLVGSPTFETLLVEAEESGVGANGLLMLPYFAGERTPLMDPDARGLIAGLTLSHTRGDLYRAALEATAFGVRHNIETMLEAGAEIKRVVAVGGGTQGDLWTQIVSDVTGFTQVIPSETIGASFGAAFLAASSSNRSLSVDDWNPVRELRTPHPDRVAEYDALYRLYRNLYPVTADISHSLAAHRRG